MPLLPATGGPELSSAATRLLATITADPGLHSPRGWALLHGWDERETSDAYRELVAAGLALPLGVVRWRLGPASRGLRSWVRRDVEHLPMVTPTERLDVLVALAWGDGHDRVADIAVEVGVAFQAVYRSLDRHARRGRCWVMMTCVPVGAARYRAAS